MITIENIKEWARPHSRCQGKFTRIGNQSFDFSIVGGDKGLYGDFNENFEVAVIDKKTGSFITKFFFETTDDVVPYLEAEELIKILNSVFKENFQVL